MAVPEHFDALKGKFVFGLIRNADYRLVAFKEGMRIYHVDAKISIPEDDDYWDFDEDVAPGTVMPQFNVTGVSVIEFDLNLEETESIETNEQLALEVGTETLLPEENPANFSSADELETVRSTWQLQDFGDQLALLTDPSEITGGLGQG